MIILLRSVIIILVLLCSVQAFGNTFYSLLPGSTFSEGCVNPCKCPVLAPVELMGTFRMGLGKPDSLFVSYRIEDIAWEVVHNGEVLHRIKGSGTYRVGGEVALLHQLELEINIDGRPTEYLDSGIVQNGREFPTISIQVSRGTECFDIWMDIQAAPLNQYVLEPGSTFSEGCVEPCMCPVWLSHLRGKLSLAHRRSDFLFDYYDIGSFSWEVGSGGNFIHHVTGQGYYRIGGEFALMHQMVLDIQIDEGPLQRLDSGLIVGGAEFPAAILISVSRGTECFDMWMHIKAGLILCSDFDWDGDVDGLDMAIVAIGGFGLNQGEVLQDLGRIDCPLNAGEIVD